MTDDMACNDIKFHYMIDIYVYIICSDALSDFTELDII